METVTLISDIMGFLKYLSRYGDMKANVEKARLVFVVPMRLKDKCPKQNMTVPQYVLGVEYPPILD